MPFFGGKIMLATAIALLSMAQLPADVPVYWTGADSKIAQPAISLLTDEKSWIRTWLKHRGRAEELKLHERQERSGEPLRYSYYVEDNLPLVNFETHVVLAMFSGTVSQSAGHTVMSVERNGEQMTLRFVPRYYSVAVSSEEELAKYRGKPFLFVLLPRTFKHLRLEKGIIEDKSKPITKFELVRVLTLP
jgi:hypothetical protein